MDIFKSGKLFGYFKSSTENVKFCVIPLEFSAGSVSEAWCGFTLFLSHTESEK